MEVLTPSTPNGFNKSIEPADPLTVLEHIANLIESTLGAARRELEAVGSLLSHANRADSLERCGRFATEGEVALYAQKDLVEETQINGHTDEDKGTLVMVCRYFEVTDKRRSTRTTLHVYAVIRILNSLDYACLSRIPQEIHCTRCEATYSQPDQYHKSSRRCCVQ